jgi:hypothetical protein
MQRRRRRPGELPDTHTNTHTHTHTHTMSPSLGTLLHQVHHPIYKYWIIQVYLLLPLFDLTLSCPFHVSTRNVAFFCVVCWCVTHLTRLMDGGIHAIIGE